MIRPLDRTMNAAPWKVPLLVLLGAAVTVVGADLALQRVAPLPPRLLEVDDGVADYEAADPTTLVLGSSQTRSFGALRDLVNADSGGAHDMILVPVEWGTFVSYQWVLEHRLRPLLEERDPATGGPKRRRLSRALLVTEFYDMCRSDDVANLPARAWQLGDYGRDVASKGMTGYNRSFVFNRWTHLFPASLLVQDRGHGRSLEGLKEWLKPLDDDDIAEHRRAALEVQSHRTEGLFKECADPPQQRAFEESVDYLLGRGLEVTIVVFPLPPGIISPLGRDTTLRQYGDYLAALARRRPVRIVDMTETAPITDDDLQSDMAHLTPAASRKLATWAYGGVLGFLKQPRADAKIQPDAGPAPGAVR